MEAKGKHAKYLRTIFFIFAPARVLRMQPGVATCRQGCLATGAKSGVTVHYVTGDSH